MAYTLDMTGMVVLAVLVLAAIYILMRFLGSPSNDEEDESEPVQQVIENPPEVRDEEFIRSYTGPIIEDALESMETAVESIRLGLYYYGRGTWEAAGEEFHSAARGIDDASGRLKEVNVLIEDQSSAPSREAKARSDECRRLRALTIRMEEACDARVDGKEEEAAKLDIVRHELEQMASSFKR